MINIVKYYIEKRMRICSTVRFWRKKGAKIGGGCSIHPSASLGEYKGGRKKEIVIQYFKRGGKRKIN